MFFTVGEPVSMQSYPPTHCPSHDVREPRLSLARGAIHHRSESVKSWAVAVGVPSSCAVHSRAESCGSSLTPNERHYYSVYIAFILLIHEGYDKYIVRMSSTLLSSSDALI